jgi:flavorubredoxin
MAVTNTQSGTNVHEIAQGIYRINTPLPADIVPGGFSFNQYLIAGEAPLLFHTGPRKLFPLVREAVSHVLPVERLRYVAFSHVESDECGSLNDWLRAAPDAVPVCSGIAALVSIEDLADRSPKALADGELLEIGGHSVRWLDAPHLPHAWECGYLFDETTKTLFCGDLFTQPGVGEKAVTEEDILGPSEAFRHSLDYYSHAKNGRTMVERIAGFEPQTLACMHGSAWRGDGGALLRALGASLDGE